MTNIPANKRYPRLAERIMEYLDNNPGAADTVDGIATWWLAERDSASPQMVEVVVRALVSEGTMERRPTPDGSAIFGLARHR